jgi:hypothetical protein
VPVGSREEGGCRSDRKECGEKGSGKRGQRFGESWKGEEVKPRRQPSFPPSPETDYSRSFRARGGKSALRRPIRWSRSRIAGPWSPSEDSPLPTTTEADVNLVEAEGRVRRSPPALRRHGRQGSQKRGQRFGESWEGEEVKPRQQPLFLPLRRQTTAVVFGREEENRLSRGRSGGRKLRSQALDHRLKVVLSRPRPRRTSIGLKLRVECGGRRPPTAAWQAGLSRTAARVGTTPPGISPTGHRP